MVLLDLMKAPDLDKERSERKLSLPEFLKTYNESLPAGFPPASLPFLREFKKTYSGLFSGEDAWSLDRHRKKFMDWRPQRTQNSTQ